MVLETAYRLPDFVTSEIWKGEDWKLEKKGLVLLEDKFENSRGGDVFKYCILAPMQPSRQHLKREKDGRK